MRLVTARRLAAAGIAAVAGLAGTTLAASPARADPVAGSIEWGFHEGWRGYALGSGGTITAGDPASVTAEGVATFPLTEQTGDEITAAGSVDYGPASGGGFTIAFSNLVLVLGDGGAAQLIVDLTFDPPGPSGASTTPDITVANLAKTGEAGGVTTFAATLDAQAVPFFGQYPAGMELDDLILTIAPPATTPTPGTTAPGGSLAQTGTSLTTLMAIGGALVVLGAGIVALVLRRRRTDAASA